MTDEMTQQRFDDMLDFVDELLGMVEEHCASAEDRSAALAMALALCGKLQGQPRDEVVNALDDMYNHCHVLSEEPLQ